MACNLSYMYDYTNGTSMTVTLSPEGIAECYHLNDVSENIRNIYIWVVFALGFPGNIFSIITVLTMQKITPATFYVALLAACDCCTITVKLISHQLETYQVYMGDFGCKMRFLAPCLFTLASWVLVLICAERFVSVCFPLRKTFIFTMRRSYMSAGILAALLLLIYVPLYFVMFASTKSGLRCGTYNDYLSFWAYGWYWINACLSFFAPFLCIVILTALIIRGLARSRRDRRSILGSGTEKQDNNRRLMDESERQERAITIMLILAALIFLLLTLPACVNLLAKPKSSDPLTRAKWTLFGQIQFVCIDSSHAVNFFLYFFSAQRFRRQFVVVFACKIWPKRDRRKRCLDSSQSTCLTKETIARSRDGISHL